MAMTTASKTTVAAGLIVLAAVAVIGWHTETEAADATKDVSTISSSESRLWVLRLKPGDDLVDSIMDFARQHSINAGGIVTCVGSLTHARLRYANQSNYEDLDTKGQHFEIISLAGTFSTTDRHLHLAVANEKGVSSAAMRVRVVRFTPLPRSSWSKVLIGRFGVRKIRLPRISSCLPFKTQSRCEPTLANWVDCPVWDYHSRNGSWAIDIN